MSRLSRTDQKNKLHTYIANKQIEAYEHGKTLGQEMYKAEVMEILQIALEDEVVPISIKTLKELKDKVMAKRAGNPVKKFYTMGFKRAQNEALMLASKPNNTVDSLVKEILAIKMI